MLILPYVAVAFNLRRVHFALKSFLCCQPIGESLCCTQQGGFYGG